MKKCLNCESYSLELINNEYVCHRCFSRMSQHEYEDRVRSSRDKENQWGKLLGDISSYYDITLEIERLNQKETQLKSKIEEAEKMLELGQLKPGNMVSIPGDDIGVIKRLLTEFNPPEIYTAAYKIRAIMEKWVKCVRLVDLNSTYLPREWDKRKAIIFSVEEDVFGDAFIDIYRKCNIFVHQNLVDLHQKKLFTDELKIDYIKLGAEFVARNNLMVQNEIRGLIRFYEKNNLFLIGRINKFFTQFPTNQFESNKDKTKLFELRKKELKRELKKQYDLYNYLISQTADAIDKPELYDFFESKYKNQYQI